jgi:hypothetical protein
MWAGEVIQNNTGIQLLYHKNKMLQKVKQSRYRPGVAQRVAGS